MARLGQQPGAEPAAGEDVLGVVGALRRQRGEVERVAAALLVQPGHTGRGGGCAQQFGALFQGQGGQFHGVRGALFDAVPQGRPQLDRRLPGAVRDEEGESALDGPADEHVDEFGGAAVRPVAVVEDQQHPAGRADQAGADEAAQLRVVVAAPGEVGRLGLGGARGQRLDQCGRLRGDRCARSLLGVPAHQGLDEGAERDVPLGFRAAAAQNRQAPRPGPVGGGGEQQGLARARVARHFDGP